MDSVRFTKASSRGSRRSPCEFVQQGPRAGGFDLIARGTSQTHDMTGPFPDAIQRRFAIEARHRMVFDETVPHDIRGLQRPAWVARLQTQYFAIGAPIRRHESFRFPIQTWRSRAWTKRKASQVGGSTSMARSATALVIGGLVDQRLLERPPVATCHATPAPAWRIGRGTTRTPAGCRSFVSSPRADTVAWLADQSGDNAAEFDLG